MRFLFLARARDAALRMEAMFANAVGVARFLQQHRRSKACVRGILTVRTGRWSTNICQRSGAVFAFDVRGGREAGQRLIASLRLWSHLATSATPRAW